MFPINKELKTAHYTYLRISISNFSPALPHNELCHLKSIVERQHIQGASLFSVRYIDIAAERVKKLDAVDVAF